jgi:hypothetical protein
VQRMLLYDSLQCALAASRAGLALPDRPANCDRLYVRCEVDSLTRMFELLSKASFAQSDALLQVVAGVVLRTMVELREVNAQDARRSAFLSLVVSVLNACSDWTPQRTRLLAPQMFELLVPLVLEPSLQVREALARAMMLFWKSK